MAIGPKTRSAALWAFKILVGLVFLAAAAAKITGAYVNSSLAKVEALKAGYDEAIMLGGDGRISLRNGGNVGDLVQCCTRPCPFFLD